MNDVEHDGFAAFVGSTEEPIRADAVLGDRAPVRYRFDYFPGVVHLVLLDSIELQGPAVGAVGWAIFEATSGMAVWITPFPEPAPADDSLTLKLNPGALLDFVSA